MKIRFVLYALLSQACASMTDKATGISFPDKETNLDIVGVGVRKKGPIKVYSVAMYGAAGQELASVPSSDKKKVFGILRKAAKKSPTPFLLEIHMKKIGAEKMASAIADSVAPRHSSKTEVEDLKEKILAGVSSKGAATKGTKLRFECSGDGVAVAVDNQSQGQVSSSGLGGAFCDVFLDDKCVSPALRQNCIENCCKN